MIDFIVNINKPMGVTSYGVVAVIKKITAENKVGHTGTLDPDATGVLPICVGRGATKLAGRLAGKDKCYRAVMTLGVVTDTQDASGQVLEKCEVNVSENCVRSVIGKFVGNIWQTPPMYSAVKINGKKLYQFAREGKTVDRACRAISIYKIEIIEFRANGCEVVMDIECSKGTYIRTLCADIGAALGCGAHMSGLVRTRSGNFKIENSATIEEFKTIFCNNIKSKSIIMASDYLT